MRGRVFIALGWVVAASAFCLALAASAPDDLDRDNRALRAELELARQGAPYLVVDAAHRRLRLAQSGALLREFEVISIETGRPILLFFDRGATPGADVAPAALRRLSPARVVHRTEVIIEGPVDLDPSGADMQIPLDPAELFPAPARVLAHFDGGYTLEVRRSGAGSPGLTRRIGWRLRDAWAALGRRPASRIRVFMSEAETGAFYRSLPQETRLLVLP